MAQTFISHEVLNMSNKFGQQAWFKFGVVNIFNQQLNCFQSSNKGTRKFFREKGQCQTTMKFTKTGTKLMAKCGVRALSLAEREYIKISNYKDIRQVKGVSKLYQLAKNSKILQFLCSTRMTFNDIKVTSYIMRNDTETIKDCNQEANSIIKRLIVKYTVLLHIYMKKQTIQMVVMTSGWVYR